MTLPETAAPAPRVQLRAALLAAALILVALAIWASQLYTTDASRACRELYAGARSAVDSNRIDLIVPAAGRKLSEPRACVNYKRRATP